MAINNNNHFPLKVFLLSFLVLISSACLFAATNQKSDQRYNQKTQEKQSMTSSTSIKVYFGNNELNPNAEDCRLVYSLDRLPTISDKPEETALKSLFQGPNDTERSQAYYSPFSTSTSGIFKSLKIEEGIAYLDLRDIRTIIPNVSASCASAQFLAEIETTLLQFPNIQKVIIALDGKPSAFYEWIQIGCPVDNNLCSEEPFKN